MDNFKEKITYWFNLSDYDLQTAYSMNDTGRFLYVGFMCHQAIEKILKAYHVKEKIVNPPYSHNLSFLSKESGIYAELTEDFKDFIDFLDPLNIKCRYPSTKDAVFSILSPEKCRELLKKTEELQAWIKSKLSEK